MNEHDQKQLQQLLGNTLAEQVCEHVKTCMCESLQLWVCMRASNSAYPPLHFLVCNMHFA